MKILLIEDDPLVSRTIAQFLIKQMGHLVIQADNGIKGIQLCEKEVFPLIISDIRMPGLDGISFLKKLKAEKGKDAPPVVLITGFATVDMAIEALRAGAFDLLKKPVDINWLADVIDKVDAHYRLLAENRQLKDKFAETIAGECGLMQEKIHKLQDAYREVVGLGRIGFFSAKMKELVKIALRAHANPEISVLIEGETGTGKDVFARLVHFGENGSQGAYVAVNCASIPETLFETELFGYQGGAFTGASKNGQIGKMELANEGTLFLDEIGEMPLSMQPKLLKALQEQEIYRIGGVTPVKLKFRIICATNCDLEKMVEEGKFRKDLYYRINTARLLIPPLRERKEEILPLAQMFLEEIARKNRQPVKFLTEEAIRLLNNNHWEGNVRHLQNAIERACFLYDGDTLDAEHFICESSHKPAKENSKIILDLPLSGRTLAEMQEDIVKKVLKMQDNNKTRAAKYLGISHNRVRRILKEM
jgi:two-component system, NtrC family, response regulator AtoC